MPTGGDKDRASYSARYGARHPFLAPWPAAALYLAWRILVAAVRPALFLALILAAGWFGLSAARQIPQLTDAEPASQPRLEQAFSSAGRSRSDRRAIWLEGVDLALQGGMRRAPDLPLAESYLQAALSIEGREALAMALMADGRRTQAVEAELRAVVAMERQARLDAALADLEQAGLDAGLEPPSLILAPADLRGRLDRARTLYGPALGEAAAWFVEPRGRALALQSLPGLPDASPVLYGDVRDVLVQGCALALASGRRIGQCRVGFLPKPDADPVLAGLSLAVFNASDAERSAARIAKAAYAAGRLDRELATQLALGGDEDLGREALLAAIMPVLTEAGSAWTQPVRFTGALEAAASDAVRASRIEPDVRARVFAALGEVRREAGALAALRLADALRRPEDAERLGLLAERSGPQLLALHALDRAVLADLVAGSRPRALVFERLPQSAQRDGALAAGLLLLALMMLAATVIMGFRRVRGGAPGGMERLDGVVTRLILGKNC